MGLCYHLNHGTRRPRVLGASMISTTLLRTAIQYKSIYSLQQYDSVYANHRLQRSTLYHGTPCKAEQTVTTAKQALQ